MTIITTITSIVKRMAITPEHRRRSEYMLGMSVKLK